METSSGKDSVKATWASFRKIKCFARYLTEEEEKRCPAVSIFLIFFGRLLCV